MSRIYHILQSRTNVTRARSIGNKKVSVSCTFIMKHRREIDSHFLREVRKKGQRNSRENGRRVSLGVITSGNKRDYASSPWTRDDARPEDASIKHKA